MSRNQSVNPISIAWARESCSSIELHCISCAYVEDVGFDGFEDWEKVIDLPRRRPHWRCPRCGMSVIEARPVYPYRNHRELYLGLTKKDE